MKQDKSIIKIIEILGKYDVIRKDNLNIFLNIKYHIYNICKAIINNKFTKITDYLNDNFKEDEWVVFCRRSNIYNSIQDICKEILYSIM